MTGPLTDAIFPTTADLLARSWIEGEATTLEPHPSYETLAWGAVEPSGD